MTAEKVVAALKKLGPATKAALAKELGVQAPELDEVIGSMVEGGTLRKAGAGRGVVFGLKDQKLPKFARKAAKTRRTAPPDRGRKASRPRKSAADDLKIGMTEDLELMVIEKGVVRLYSPAETQKLATVILPHFEKPRA